MPKTPSSMSPYRLSLPSPSGLPPRSTYYRRPSPPTPSPPSRNTPRGVLFDIPSSTTPRALVKEEDPDIGLPPLLSPFRWGGEPTTGRVSASGNLNLKMEDDDTTDLWSLPKDHVQRASTARGSALRGESWHEPAVQGAYGDQLPGGHGGPWTGHLPTTPLNLAPPQASPSFKFRTRKGLSTRRGSRKAFRGSVRPPAIAPPQPRNQSPINGPSRTFRKPCLTSARRMRQAIVIGFKAQASSARRRLLRAQVEIDNLKSHVERLGHSEKRLKRKVAEEKELMKDTRVEAEEARAEALRAEEKIDEMTAGMESLRREFNQYRGWWLTENRSLKLVLREVPKKKWDAGLEAIASSSHGRYMTYCGNGSN